jgi:RNA polymerase sigma-70 factor (ECF subfamily)
MLVVLPRPSAAELPAAVEQPAMAIQPGFAPERFFPPDDPEWPGHWANPPTSWTDAGLPLDSPEALAQARAAIADMPAELRQVLVLRDVDGRSADDVSEALSLSPDEQLSRLHQARGLVRARLERYFDSKEEP